MVRYKPSTTLESRARRPGPAFPLLRTAACAGDVSPWAPTHAVTASAAAVAKRRRFPGV